MNHKSLLRRLYFKLVFPPEFLKGGKFCNILKAYVKNDENKMLADHKTTKNICFFVIPKQG